MSNRRQFLRGSLATAVGVSAAGSSFLQTSAFANEAEVLSGDSGDSIGGSDSSETPGKDAEKLPCTGRFSEAAREIPLTEDCDVIVCGGGPAGIAAACSAARAGARVRLFELQGSLGGIWTSGLLTFIFDFDKSDFGWELIHRLDELNARHCKDTQNFVYEPEYMKFIIEDLCLEAGVKFTLQCPVTAVYRDASGRSIETIVTESKSGRQAWRAPVFIDATGDGDLSALAGCGFDMGVTPEGYGQPATLNALVVVRDASQLSTYISNVPDMGNHIPAFSAFLRLLQKIGIQPSYFNPTLFQVHENLLLMMINHEYKVRVDNTQAISDATVRARREVLKIAAALDKFGGPWAGIRVAATAEQLGHRCGRRIHGRYTVTKEDVANGAKFDDAVTTSRFCVDIHALDFEKNKTETIAHAAFQPFQIPMRSLQAKDVDNLLMAGRCISGDFIAHASYRVTGSAVAMGEAAGKAAAAMAKGG